MIRLGLLETAWAQQLLELELPWCTSPDPNYFFSDEFACLKAEPIAITSYGRRIYIKLI